MNQSIITQTGKKVLRASFASQNLNCVSIDVLCFLLEPFIVFVKYLLVVLQRLCA